MNVGRRQAYNFLILLTTLFISYALSNAQQYIPGEIYGGRNNYIAYYAGELPLIFSAPHGGYLTPSEIPDRTYGTTGTDRKTIETVLALREAVFNFTGKYPHVIISRLKRTKLDPNREIIEAAQGNQWAEQAWYEYHSFIDIAKDSVTTHFGKGFYADIHGHGHSIERLELGYLLSSSNLMLSDNQLNSTYYINKSSLKALAAETPVSFPQLIRGSKSLGTLLEEREIPSVPSSAQINPGSGNPYFSGGYNTKRHGSRDGGTISGVQIECHYTGIRDNSENRENFAEKLTESLNIYFQEHFGWNGILTGISNKEVVIPTNFILEQNHPNPFNSSTIFQFSVPENSFISLKIYNLLGEEVRTLISENYLMGNYQKVWNAIGLPNGIYYCLIEAKTSSKRKLFSKTRKLNYIK
jgi:hypothetical protein